MDREKVINELNECIEHIRKNKFNKIPCWGNCQSAMIDALALLKEQEHKDRLFHALEDDWKRVNDLLKEQKWIPVTERLPKSMINRVLVYVQHEDLTGYIGFGHFEKFKGEELWYDLENNCQFSMRGYTVTHWMETPIPPMEGR